MVRLKKFIIAGFLAVVLLVVVVSPVLAATYEDWGSSPQYGGLIEMHYSINPTNLQVASFTIINNSTDRWAQINICIQDQQTGNYAAPFFKVTAAPGQTITQPISNFKFHRLPHTDPNDPDSLQNPPNTVIMFAVDSSPLN